MTRLVLGHHSSTLADFEGASEAALHLPEESAASCTDSIPARDSVGAVD
jgi:hypothetical protein